MFMVSTFSQTQMIVNTTPSNLKSYFKCETCLQICADEKSLVEHCKKHKDVSPWQCVECDMIFTQKTSLLKHVMCHVSESSLHRIVLFEEKTNKNL